MKFIITENKLYDALYTHLTEFYEPDYSWGPELFNFYKKDVEKHGYVEFFINNIPEFTYYDAKWNKKQLEIGEKITSELNSFFGEYWVNPFVKWFEKNTNLKVNEVLLLTNGIKKKLQV